MIKTWTHSRKERSCFKARMLMAALAIVLIIGLAATTYTASGAERDRQPSGQMKYFDPFELTTIDVDVPGSTTIAGIANPPETESSPLGTEASSVPADTNGLHSRSPIKIPCRYRCRSPFKPPWVPGPPPWFPGPPTWVPGPPPWAGKP